MSLYLIPTIFNFHLYLLVKKANEIQKLIHLVWILSKCVGVSKMANNYTTFFFSCENRAIKI